MKRTAYIVGCSVVLFALAALTGCSSTPPAGEAKKAAPAPTKIEGKLRVLQLSGSVSDSALNGGAGSVFVWEGMRQYRLFSRRTADVIDGERYAVEGIYAQKMIDELGDPAQGKGGYPLLASCERVVKTAWPGLSFEEVDVKASALRARVSRYPARPIILVTKIHSVPKKEGAADDEDKDDNLPIVKVPADQQKVLLISGAAVQPAPLWEPAGGTVRCKVIIGRAGTVTELETGAQLCEAVPWAEFRYPPPMQGGRPAKIRTEVEVRYEPRK